MDNILVHPHIQEKDAMFVWFNENIYKKNDDKRLKSGNNSNFVDKKRKACFNKTILSGFLRNLLRR